MAQYNTTSHYPDDVDALVFLCDISLDTKELYEHHQKLINERKYSEASKYLNQQTEITPVTADFFNMLEARLLTTQAYLLTKEKNSSISYSDTAEPTDTQDTPIWISTMNVK